MTNTYTTRNEAIQREIIDPIEAGEATAEEHDIDAIADAVLGDYDQGFACLTDVETFWRLVEENLR